MWKEAWPGMTESEYTYLMETNEDDGDVSAFLEFSAAMDRATNDWELVQVAKQWMKAKMVARYWVSRTIVVAIVSS